MKHQPLFVLSIMALPLWAPAQEAKLQDVVVTATRTRMDARKLPAASNVVRAKDIQMDAGSENYYKALRNSPGIVVGNSMSGDMVTLRGQAPSMLADGRDMNAFVASTNMMNSPLGIGMGAIERIEVI